MAPIALAIVAVAAIITNGLKRARKDGVIDPLHPLLYPTIYIAIVSLAPTAWLFTRGDLGYVRTDLLSADTPRLMALAAVGFAAGAWVPFARPPVKGRPGDAATMVLAGRFLLLLPLLFAAKGVLDGLVLTRGQNQAERTLTDSLDVFAFLIAPTCVALIAAGRTHLPNPLARRDLVAALALIGLLGINGRRGSAISVVLVIAFAYIHRSEVRAKLSSILGASGLLLGFSYLVAVYRTRAAGGTTELTFTEVVLRDLASVPFTTGITSRLASGQYQGSTLAAAAVRQLPAPVANALIGPPDDTGAFIFRDIFYVNDNAGYGFAIPADGVLNFGTVGAFLLPFTFGLAIAWLYARADFDATRATQLGFYIAAATLPFAWRSDVLGATKGILYPLAIIWAVFVYARSMRRRYKGRLSRSSARNAMSDRRSADTWVRTP